MGAGFEAAHSCRDGSAASVVAASVERVNARLLIANPAPARRCSVADPRSRRLNEVSIIAVSSQSHSPDRVGRPFERRREFVSSLRASRGP